MTLRLLPAMLITFLMLGLPLSHGTPETTHPSLRDLCDHHTKECREVPPAALGLRSPPTAALLPPMAFAASGAEEDSVEAERETMFRAHERSKELSSAIQILAKAGHHVAATAHQNDDGSVSIDYSADLSAQAKAKLWSIFGKHQAQAERNASMSGNETVGGNETLGGGDSSSREPAVPCRDARGCPDLIVDLSKLLLENAVVSETFAPDDCNVVEGSTQAGQRDLLRFSFGSPNIGDGDLVIGAPHAEPGWFEWGTCHGHWHFREYADYRFWTPEGYAQWQAARLQNPDALADEVLAAHPELQQHLVAGHKQGFCVIDIDWWHPLAGQRYTSCAHNQGISTGWMDVYYLYLDGQFVDVTGLPNGVYVLEAEVNPERFYEESDYSNNSGAVLVALTGGESQPPTIPSPPPVLE